MTKKDLAQIMDLFNRGFTEAFGRIWTDNLEPNFTRIYLKIDGLEKKVNGLDGKVGNLATKEYIDDKFAEGDRRLIEKLRKESS